MCGCGKKKTSKATSQVEEMRKTGVSTEQLLVEITNSDEFVDVIYNGPKYPHAMRSATGIIADYGVYDYGIGKRGDVIKVHEADFAKSKGKLYLPYTEEGIQEMAKQGIRTVGFIDQSNFSAEAESNRVARAALDKQLKEMDHPNAYVSPAKVEAQAQEAAAKAEQEAEKATTESAKKAKAQDGAQVSNAAATNVEANAQDETNVNSANLVELTQASAEAAGPTEAQAAERTADDTDAETTTDSGRSRSTKKK